MAAREEVKEREAVKRDYGRNDNRDPKTEDFARTFDAVRLGLASPETILDWSHGEVSKPETINYRTQKPEKDGLFDERIFGPTKDWECYCGKYKRIRYKGVICDKCGVEVIRSIVRRERMAHIKLIVPVAHIWFVRGTPSTIGLLLNLSVRDVERVAYFANFIIEEVDHAAVKEAVREIEEEYKREKASEVAKFDVKIKEAEKAKAAAKDDAKKKHEAQIATLTTEKAEALAELETVKSSTKNEIEGLAPMQIITEMKYRDLSIKYGHVFKAGIGAEAIRRLLESTDLEKLIKQLREEEGNSVGQKKKKAQKRLKLAEGMRAANLKPEWTVLTVLPVIPPDLRPMVQLDGGRFAASDLNDLYRRVINRNNRLKRLIELDAPEIIQRNEKRMLQEAVDALIDNNARRERAVSLAGNRRRLKSLADMLKGKQGRFRQNLLGKRVDYSGRSVIVVGPKLKLNECGLPKMMALELFKPFVIGKLIKDELAHNVRSAARMIERARTEVWDALEEVIKDKYVLLNRAPTLHRLGVQAFKPVLIEGKAIQIHPLVCEAFNADFDGDQMAVHVPLSVKAQSEAAEIMFSPKNLLKPSSGEPIVNARHEMVLGIYYLTGQKPGAKGEGKQFSNFDEAIYAYKLRLIDLTAMVKVKHGKVLIDTTAGRILFNEALPEGIEYQNTQVNKSQLKKIIAEIFEKHGTEKTVEVVDYLKDLGFKFAMRSGLTIGVDDLKIPESKKQVIDEAEKRIKEIKNQFAMGLITNDERYHKVLEVWNIAKDAVIDALKDTLDPAGPVAMMMDSGARGDITQVGQLAAMKGLVANPSGRIIELAIKSNYKEGFSVLEYFISSHAARKGGADTALRTADSGYLTRRMVDVAQDLIIVEDDCGEKEGFAIAKADSVEVGEELWKFSQRLFGRYLAVDVMIHGKAKAARGDMIDGQLAAELAENVAVESVAVRSPLTCKSTTGICKKCYGIDLAHGQAVKTGEAVGIIAAQSIGEPGTQLTMRTFHTGGIAQVDITQGLPRVEELFEARAPKGQAFLAELSGKVEIKEEPHRKVVTIHSEDAKKDIYEIPEKFEVQVKAGDAAMLKQVLASHGKSSVKVKVEGTVLSVGKGEIVVAQHSKKLEYNVPNNVSLKVKNGDDVKMGDQLTDGSLNLQDYLALRGEEATRRYIIKEIQQIYLSQGQSINDKHIEVIVRQMFSRVHIDDAGDSLLIAGQYVSRARFAEENKTLKAAGKTPTKGTPLLLPISKVALTTDSFLSAASFQETTRVLIAAAIKQDVDHLRGLKENVIIGKLIPVGTGYRKGK